MHYCCCLHYVLRFHSNSYQGSYTHNTVSVPSIQCQFPMSMCYPSSPDNYSGHHLHNRSTQYIAIHPFWSFRFHQLNSNHYLRSYAPLCHPDNNSCCHHRHCRSFRLHNNPHLPSRSLLVFDMPHYWSNIHFLPFHPRFQHCSRMQHSHMPDYCTCHMCKSHTLSSLDLSMLSGTQSMHDSWYCCNTGLHHRYRPRCLDSHLGTMYMSYCRQNRSRICLNPQTMSIPPLPRCSRCPRSWSTHRLHMPHQTWFLYSHCNLSSQFHLHTNSHSSMSDMLYNWSRCCWHSNHCSQ